ncbi:unnamed protein product [Cyprideis torosa]|uniref:Uncharacterized protein n=1 Tax=Cyprideis torosa TaxID=163714 RepID=A0A7R8W7C4_9CRUS|nr:unnamed protein product [Cyprideis torosa]CAG0885044.1 unnamed protein product [Cyprideis torosa]
MSVHDSIVDGLSASDLPHPPLKMTEKEGPVLLAIRRLSMDVDVKQIGIMWCWGLPVSSHEGPESMPLHGRHGKDSVELSAIPRSRSIDDIQEEEDALAGATLAAAESLESEVTSEEEDEVTDEATNPNQGFPNSSSNSALVRESALGSKTKRPHQRSLASSASEQKKQMKKFAIGLGEESDTMPDTPNRLWPNTKTKDERYHIDPETMEVSTVGEAYRKDAQRKWKHYASASFWSMTSALYGKILVVMGLAFPLAEVISNDVPTYFFNGFYLYLKLGSVVFLLYVYIYLISTKKLTSRGLKRAATNDSLSVATFFIRSAKSMASLHDYFRKNLGKETSNGKKSGPSRTLSKEEGSASIDLDEGMDDGLQSSSQGGGFMRTDSSSDGGPHLIPFIKEEESVHYGSFYLRLGVVAFGTGNMIYSGLEVTRFIDMEEGCSAPLTPLAAGVRCLFTFIQMYFVFLNSKMMIPKRFYLGQFGLMHMIATNLCVWLHVLVEESKHEFLTLTTEGDYISDVSHTGGEHLSNTTEEHHVLKDEGHLPKDVASDLHDKHSLHYCDRSSVMGRLVQDASPFLFPCVIEYSLICAAILYVMWKNLNPKPPDEAGKNKTKSSHSMIKITSKQSRHVYHMDCEGANRGLFVGILVMVLTAISLIVFFVLMQSDEMKDMAITEANISELCLYTLTSLAACIGMFRMRNMRYEMGKDLEIDQILLIVAQSGLFLYSIFVIIGSYFVAAWDISVIPMITGLAMLIQAILQTAFILDASRRCCTNSKQVRVAPPSPVLSLPPFSNAPSTSREFHWLGADRSCKHNVDDKEHTQSRASSGVLFSSILLAE